jgi:hypothetical protein
VVSFKPFAKVSMTHTGKGENCIADVSAANTCLYRSNRKIRNEFLIIVIGELAKEFGPNRNEEEQKTGERVDSREARKWSGPRTENGRLQRFFEM